MAFHHEGLFNSNFVIIEFVLDLHCGANDEKKGKKIRSRIFYRTEVKMSEKSTGRNLRWVRASLHRKSLTSRKWRQESGVEG